METVQDLVRTTMNRSPERRRHASEPELDFICDLISINLVDEAAGARTYMKSLFKLTLKRSEFCNSEDTYYCTYKFGVHAGDDQNVVVQENSTKYRYVTSDAVSFYRERIPCNWADDCGILLIIVLQWEIRCVPDDSFILLLGTYDRAFFVSKSDSRKTEHALRDILSPILHGLGILSPDDVQSVAQRLVSSTYSKFKLCESSSGGWIPVVVEIAVERVTADVVLETLEDCCMWGVRDARHYVGGFELMTSNKASKLQEEGECCPICLREFDVESEIVRMPSCSHVYHPNCIMEWLIVQKHKSCPSCRAMVTESHNWRKCMKFLLLK